MTVAQPADGLAAAETDGVLAARRRGLQQIDDDCDGTVDEAFDFTSNPLTAAAASGVPVRELRHGLRWTAMRDQGLLSG